jgi:hypothetical protein
MFEKAFSAATQHLAPAVIEIETYKLLHIITEESEFTPCIKTMLIILYLQDIPSNLVYQYITSVKRWLLNI